MILYQDHIDNIKAEMLQGFFKGWDKHPLPGKFLELLKNSEYKILALDEENKKVAGFINALSDKVLSAYIPLLEVLPEYQHKGIGTELVKRMMDKLNEFYMIDLACDEDRQSFYSGFGFKKYSAMIKRNYDNQKGITGKQSH